METLASTAIILSSEVLRTGFISNKLASLSTYALYRLVTNLVISLKAVPDNPKLKAIFLAWKGNKPVAGFISSVK